MLRNLPIKALLGILLFAISAGAQGIGGKAGIGGNAGIGGGSTAGLPAIISTCHGFTYTTSSAANCTGATLIVIVMYKTANSISAPTSSPSNTYTAQTVYGNVTGGTYAQIYYICGPSVSSSMTFTDNSGGGSTLMYVGVTGTATSSCADGTGSGFAATSTGASIQPGSITPSQTNDFLITWTDYPGAANTQTITNSFTQLDQATSFSPFTTDAYLLYNSTSAINPTWTNSAGTGILVSVMAAFAP